MQATIDNFTAAIQDLQTMLEWAKDEAIRPTLDADRVVYFEAHSKIVASAAETAMRNAKAILSIPD